MQVAWKLIDLRTICRILCASRAEAAIAGITFLVALFVAFLPFADGQDVIAGTPLISIQVDRTRDDMRDKSTGPLPSVRRGPDLLTWLDPI